MTIPGAPSNRILIVEDVVELREAMALYLRLVGYEVETAVDGRDGLAKLEQCDPLPCAILSNRDMPVMSGPEMIAAIRQNAKLASIPIAVISGSLGAVPGANRVLRKPLDPEALRHTVKELCGEADRNRSVR